MIYSEYWAVDIIWYDRSTFDSEIIYEINQFFFDLGNNLDLSSFMSLLLGGLNEWFSKILLFAISISYLLFSELFEP